MYGTVQPGLSRMQTKMVYKEFKAYKVCRDLDTLNFKAFKVCRVYKEHKVLKDFRDFKACKVYKELLRQV